MNANLIHAKTVESAIIWSMATCVAVQISLLEITVKRVII